jgi:peptide deformylase
MPGMTASIETLPILVVPDPILKARARQVATTDMEKVRALVPRMFATMYAAPGIGLAAPQVGAGLRVAVVDLMANDKSAPYVLINPEVIARSDELATREEGCLSLPGQYADVTRPARVTIRYMDIEGAKRQIDAEGLLAACMQHEIDHLDGMLFIFRMSALKRDLNLRKIRKMQREGKW